VASGAGAGFAQFVVMLFIDSALRLGVLGFVLSSKPELPNGE
jgi:hypothetical protein